MAEMNNFQQGALVLFGQNPCFPLIYSA